MSDIPQLRADLLQARAAQDAASDELAVARAEAREAGRRLDAHRRSAPAGQPGGDVAGDALRLALDAANASVAQQRSARAAAIAVERDLLVNAHALTDPRTGIAALDDGVPILMMPVRLETRFKTVSTPGAPDKRQLWLRIYPDDCWIDGFTADLTETELADVTRYRADLWAAGGIEAQQRAAWARLVAGRGSGRAAWLAESVQPLNPADQPVKVNPDDLILVLTAAAVPAAGEVAAIAAYWRALWLADGDAAASTAARTALDTAVGAARAAGIAAGPPVNFATVPAAGIARVGIAVTVATIVLPTVTTRTAAWSNAPRIDLLPERFVFVGYPADGAPPIVKLGGTVHPVLHVAPDPAADATQQIRPDGVGGVIVPDELRWLSDFATAEEAGMAMRIDLHGASAEQGFARVLVAGVRLGADAATGKARFEQLLTHHAYAGMGIAVLPQGTPTNNTEDMGSGAARLDDPDVSFDARADDAFTATNDWRDKRDGQWLAEYLGIDPALFRHVAGAGGTDRRAAAAMHEALWPATLGYWMETMMAPVFGRDSIDHTRDFLARHVVAGGGCPSLRIGWQPYGILSTTVLSRMDWLPAADAAPHLAVGQHSWLRGLRTLIGALDADLATLANDVSHVGKAGDPHQILLDIVGLHPGSVEWTQRYAESVETLINRLSLQGLGGLFEKLLTIAERSAAKDVLAKFGYAGRIDPPLLDLIFSGRHQVMNGGVIDDRPLSEIAPIRAYTTGGDNYLQWLIDATQTSLDALYLQDRFRDDRPPAALLYLMLRHALQLGYHEVGIRLHEKAGLMSAGQALLARQDDPFIAIRADANASESRYTPLYATAPAITGDATQPVHRFIAEQFAVLDVADHARRQVDAIERLTDEPTARLERAFADHIDCCTYRLDPWLLGFVDNRIGNLRGLDAGGQASPQQGLHLGAYAWLEDLKPDDVMRGPIAIDDPALAAIFAGDPPLVHDPANEGFIHGPSLNHAVTAAVLRNGYLSNADPVRRGKMAVNLTSERVRVALGLLEGIRAGQSLADLLGYRLERGLHDRYNLPGIDAWIYTLRHAFPLRADRLAETKPPEGVPIEAIEARNVVNGLALVSQIEKSGQATWPFGRADLTAAIDPAFAAAINAEVDKLLDAHDSVADLALAEGVYQSVLGNYDRVASTYDAYARGAFPPEPDVVRTPLDGAGLTQRVALHLDAGADPLVSPVGGTPTPRAIIEPAVNAWLAEVLPDPADIALMVDYVDAVTGATTSAQITLSNLELEPADLIALLHEDDEAAMSEFDDRVQRAARALGPRPDQPITIRYMDKTTAAQSVFEVLPLVRNLRHLIQRSRPLRATDCALMNEARAHHDDALAIDQSRIDLIVTRMGELRDDLQTYLTTLEPLLADPVTNRAAIVAAIEARIDSLVALLARGAGFGVRQAGWGMVHDFVGSTFTAILAQAAELVARWDDKRAAYDAALADAAAASGEGEKLFYLRRADLAIATDPVAPPPATAAAYLATLTGVQLPAFLAARAGFVALQTTTRTRISDLLDDVAALLPVRPFDVVAYDLGSHEDAIVRFSVDAAALARAVRDELDRRLAAANDALLVAAAAADAAATVDLLTKAAKALLGDETLILPAFTLAPDAASEFANAHAASQTAAPFLHLTAPADPARAAIDFPADDWLYGVARVRDKMRAWEQMVMHAGGFGTPDPALAHLQLPFAPSDRWLGLDIPADYALDGDRLLYAAHVAGGVAVASGPQCGVLIDEWTETVPAGTIDTGIVFHHDRPDNEAPQAMLLLTPARADGAWVWEDVIDALGETLDLAKRRAVEPAHIDNTPYATFAPATVIASQVHQLTIALDLALNNKISLP